MAANININAPANMTTNAIANTTANCNKPSAPHHDKYWRLNTYQNTPRYTLLKNLEAKSLAFKPDIRKLELVEVQHRLDRGLLHYEDKRITNKELARFIQDRQLPKPVASTRKAMISILMGADEALRFEKFVDLPPELRERIFQFHISSLPERLFCPTQPPVTRACKLFRKEALPVFHKLTTFESRFYLIKDKYELGDNVSKAELRPCFETLQFLNSLRTTDEAKIRLDRIVVYAMQASMKEMQHSVGHVIVCCGYEKGHPTGGQKISCHGIAAENRDIAVGLRRENRSFFAKHSDRSTFFSLDDIYKLRGVFETAIFSTVQEFGDL